MIGGQLRLAHAFPALRDGAPRAAWLRISSAWSYDVFIDQSWLGSGGASGKREAYDLTRYLRPHPHRVTIVLHRPDASAAPMPLAIVDGEIGDVPVGPQGDWQTLRSEQGDFLAGQGEWIATARVGVP